jgi:ATP-dependent protease HslVU (ClpYQ) peptidase subunit
MTTVTAVQGQGWVTMAADSLSTDGSRYYLLSPTTPKIITVGPFMLGFAGDMRAINAATAEFDPTYPPDATDEELDKFMVGVFRREFRDLMDESGFKKVGDFQVIISVNGVLYETGDQYDIVRDTHPIAAVGSGSSYALGAMAALHGEKPLCSISAGSRLAKSGIQAAEAFDLNTRGPIVTATWRQPSRPVKKRPKQAPTVSSPAA